MESLTSFSAENMPLVSVRALVIFQFYATDGSKASETNEKVLLVQRFPTVELRAVKAGQMSLPNTDQELIERILPEARKRHRRNGKSHIVMGVAFEGSTATVRELLDEVERIIEVAFNKYSHNDDVRYYISALLSKAIPFGSPVQTLPNTICGDFMNVSGPTENKCPLPTTMGRALPNWFPSPTKNTEKPVQRLATTLLRSPEVVVWLEDRVNAIMYRHEPEFQGEPNVARFWSVSSCLKCISHLRQPSEVIVSITTMQQPFGVHECVQRIERDDNRVKLQLVPLPFLGLSEKEFSKIVLAHFRIDSFKPSPGDSDVRLREESLEGHSNGVLFEKFPLRATYRLRQAAPVAAVSERTEYQVVMRVSLNLNDRSRPLFQVKKLEARLQLPSLVTIDEIKTQASSGTVSFHGNTLVWTINETISGTSGTALLSGVVLCRSLSEKDSSSCNILLHGETSYALIDFSLQGAKAKGNPQCKIQSIEIAGQSVRINDDLREVTSGTFLVWNPFGDFVKGVPLSALADCESSNLLGSRC